jgi:Flp pilus assembly protein TadD
MIRRLLLCCLGLCAFAQSPAPDAWSAADVRAAWQGHLRFLLRQAPRDALIVETYCRQALAIQADDLPVATRLAEYYLERGEAGMAAMCLLYLKLLDPGHPLVRLQWESALNRMDVFPGGPSRLEEIDPASPLADVLRRAAQALREGQPVRAENLYRALLAEYPANRILLDALGGVYVRQEDWAMAAMLYRFALHLYPDDPGFANNYALSLDRIGRAATATEVLVLYRERFPRDARLARNLGQILWRQGDIDAAAEAFAAWTAAAPLDAAAWRAYGESLLRKDKLIFAKVALRKAADLDAADLLAPELLLRAAVAEGKSDEITRWGLALRARMKPDDWRDLIGRAPYAGLSLLENLP